METIKTIMSSLASLKGTYCAEYETRLDELAAAPPRPLLPAKEEAYAYSTDEDITPSHQNVNNDKDTCIIDEENNPPIAAMNNSSLPSSSNKRAIIDKVSKPPKKLRSSKKTKQKEIIQLLNKKNFDENDFSNLVIVLQKDPTAASQTGSHDRSTIWVCCQQSHCYWRRLLALPLLIKCGADVNAAADNGYTPLMSLFNRRNGKNKEYKWNMARQLVYEFHATVPKVDGRGNEIDIHQWLKDSIVNNEG